jgi:hypothetical protein
MLSSLSEDRGSLIIFLGLFSAFHNVAFLEQDLLQYPLPLWLAAQQKFQVHSEMLEFLALRISHNRSGISILFNRQPLLVPVDSVCLFYQRRYHAREGPRFLREFICWLVVLLKSHNVVGLIRER